MISQITMPWWGWLYMLFVTAMFISSFFAEERPNMNEILGSSLSLFTICIFVVGFFNVFVADFLGLFLIPMLAIGVFWEFSHALSETERAKEVLLEQNDLTDGEKNFLLDAAIAFNALVVVPGYVMGLVVCINVIKAMGYA